MKVAIVGYATEGEESARYWHALGNEVTVCDVNTSLQIPAEYDSRLGESYLENLDVFDVVVRTAGMHPRLLLEKNPSIISKITTSLGEFMRV